MNQSLEVQLMPPSIWAAVVDQEFSSLPAPTARTARAVLTTLHDRHIGITPQLAAELAKRISDAHFYRRGKGKWDPVLERLLAENSAGLRTVGVLLNAVPLYSIIRLAAPILEEACTRIGLCVLFCRDEIETNDTVNDYTQYALQLEKEIRAMAGNRDDYFRTFWKDRALTLASLSRHAPDWSDGNARLAETEPSALSLLLNLKPRLQQARNVAIQPKTVLNPMKHREVRRLREGGFSGIHLTRRIEDMGDILMSEFINPPAVLADRLINNGYLALKRQTRREQLRDVLVVGLMPHGITPSAGVDFIKACWFDFIARFGFMLYKSRLMRSEFRWLEGDAFDRVRSCDFLLKELPEVPVNSEMTPQFKHEFLKSLGWLPRYLDNRSRFQKVPVYDALPQQLNVAGESGTQRQRRWAYSAWRAQQENLLWGFYETGEHKTDSKQRLDISGFSFVHIMLFLPASKRVGRTASSASRLGPLYSGLGIGGSLGTGAGYKSSASITWVPRQLTAAEEWAYDCRGGRREALFSSAVKGLNSHRIAGHLEEAWRRQLLKELQDA